MNQCPNDASHRLGPAAGGGLCCLSCCVVAVDTETQPDATVNHPPHYTAHPSGVECITIAEHFGFNLGNAIKYIWRAGLKGDVIEDLKKARFYLEREIARRSVS